MNESDFVALGFNVNEAKTYKALLRFGNSSAAQLIKETKFHKNIVYDNLQKLIDKGLVTVITKEGVREYSAAPPHMLLELINEREKSLKEQKLLAERLIDEIQKTQKAFPESQNAEVLVGKNGIRAFYAQTLKLGNYVVFGAPGKSIDIMGEHFWLNYNRKLAETKIKARLIFNPSIRAYGEQLKNKQLDIRYFDRDFEPKTETHIQKNRVAIIVWTEEPMLFLITSKTVSGSYHAYFEKMWKEAK